jgi:Protein of unknown function (DUF3800)
VVRAYLDVSGQKTDPVVVVAGFLGWVSNYERFERQWEAFRNEFGLEQFHATEFWARRSRPYNGWNNEKHLKAKRDICEILSDELGPPFGIGVAVNIKQFNEWRDGLDHYYPSDPYYFCLDRVLYTLVYSTGPHDEGITVYCDQEKEHELLGVEIARWHEARLNKDPSLATNPINTPRPVSVHYGPKREFIPIQLADILANDTFKRVSYYIRTGLRATPYFTKCLTKNPKHKDRIVIYHYNDVEMFEFDHRLRFRNKPEPST